MKRLIYVSIVLLCASCNNKDIKYDATGTFESTEIMVSSEIPGKILNLDIQEGDTVAPNVTLGCMDTLQLYLTKLQLSKNAFSIKSNLPQISIQIAAIKDQIKKQYVDKQRIENLLKAKAATQKQLDDVNSSIEILRSQLKALSSTLQNNTASLNAQSSATDIQIAQINDKLNKCHIQSPIRGTILDKYHYAGEIVNTGMPLFKVADIDNIYLRAYVTSGQLANIKLRQKVKVYADFGGEKIKEYPGIITWISPKSEFTPKNIQTADERENSVYAMKIAVKNDGLIKLGMYGEVKF